jgi:hypothetical protein
MAENKLSDEEIFKLIEEFEALKEEDKAKRLLGKGSRNFVYEIPNQDMVMKVPQPYDRWSPEEIPLHKDYIYGKKLAKELPVETPILVKRPQKQDVLLQKKLSPLAKEISPDYDKMSLEEIKNYRKERFKESRTSDYTKLLEEADTKQIEGGDIHKGNVAYDKNGKLKLIDWDEFGYWGDSPEIESKAQSLYKTKNTFLDKMDSMTKPRIYRSIPLIGPAIGAGLAAMSGEANAASALPILGEADSLGPEQGSEDYEIENPHRNPAARRAALESLLKK